MKTIIIYIILIISSIDCYSQCFKEWYSNNVKIRQSLESSDLQKEPAQIQMTILDKDTISYLMNIGMSINLNKLESPEFLSTINVEYHRNTQIKKEQNNFQVGYGYNWKFFNKKNTNYHLLGDIKYVKDNIDTTNSLGGNVLCTWLKDESRINWNTNNFFNSNKESYFLSFFFGGQYQYIFNSGNSNLKGFILRPLYTANFVFSINNSDELPYNPILSLSAVYTGRYDIINSTKKTEGYTHLLKTGVDWYLVYEPIKVSLGFSFNYGSDPIQGKKDQKYWLLSLNLIK